MTKQEQFFYDHAGYSWNAAQGETEEQGHIRCAVELARAERWMQEVGIEARWENDPYADPMDWDGEGPMGEEAFCCIVGTESLCGICDPDSNYRRVVEAELAMEAMANTDLTLVA